MSADSPKRSAVRCVPAVVPPQVVSDRSLIDSVAGFINDVTLTSPPQGDPKEQVLWVRFENMADISDPTCGDDWELEGNVPPPLVIILGFGSGIKVYALPAHGEAVEVLGWRHGTVKALRILPTPISTDDEMANEPIDQFVDQRPLMALCDTTTTGCAQQNCSVSFISLKNGAQVKIIKFKNPVVDILANRTSVVVTFQEKIAVFDARNLEDRLSITSCHPSPGISPNPVALGARWMAYAEWKLLPSKRSSGGCDCEGVSSYTATVLNAAKSLGKGLRELGEQVAAGLTGSGSNGGSASSSKSGSFESNTGDLRQPGLVTIVDVKYPIKETSPTTGSPVTSTGTDPIIAHFIAHSDAIVALEFDPSGMLLLTADRRGHDFHVFRIQPHPAGSHLASVHHLYVLHRGDTSAKIQDIAFSLDSRWVAVSSLRGTTHVFPITPYGGSAGVRTHGSLHVVNRLSRFHRSAGLTVEGRSSSPLSHTESVCNQSCTPFSNPRTPPFPRPMVMHALAQIRQPFALGTPPGSAQNSYTRSGSGRQRLSSLSDDTGKEMRVCAVFAKARSWLLEPPNAARETPSHRMQRKAVDSVFIMAGHGALIQYDLDVKLASNIAKEKICDDTAIELEVEAKAQWYLGRRENSPDIQPPLPRDNWLMRDPSYPSSDSDTNSKDADDQNDRWLSQVEIITHAGPHRRLWMGPQFVFKTYNTPSGAPLSHIDTEAVEIGINPITNRPGRSSPMNMPLSGCSKGSVPVMIESGSYSEFPSSFEQSPKLSDRFRHGHVDSDFSFTHGDSRLKEDLADAMRESPSVTQRDTGLTRVTISPSPQPTSSTTLQSGPSTSSGGDADTHKSGIPSDATKLRPIQTHVLIEKVVNPLGTVTTITRSPSENDFDPNNSNEFDDDDYIIHENCDESLFRPVVAIFCDDSKVKSDSILDPAHIKPPEAVGTELIVPVTEEKPSICLTVIKSGGPLQSKKDQLKTKQNDREAIGGEKPKASDNSASEIAKFDEMTLINRKTAKASKKSSKEKEPSPPLSVTAKKEKRASTSSTTATVEAADKKTTDADKNVPKKEKSPPPVEKSRNTNPSPKVKCDELAFIENTQSVKCDIQKSEPATPAVTTVVVDTTKGKENVGEKKKPSMSEATKSSETSAPATKKEHSFSAASSFDSIISVSKKVIEKAEKVLAPGKKSDKATMAKSTKTTEESVSKPDPIIANVADDKDVIRTNRPELLEPPECSVVSLAEPQAMPEVKKAGNNKKSRKSKEKSPATSTIEDDDAASKSKSKSTVEDSGLAFYDKFTESDIRTVELDDFPRLHKMQLTELEYPSLTATLGEMKANGKKSKTILSTSPKQSPQKMKNEPTKSDKNDVVASVPSVEVEICETVTLALSPKKKNKKGTSVIHSASSSDQETKSYSKTVKPSTDENKTSAKETRDVSTVSLVGSEKTTKTKDISNQLSFELISPPEYPETILPPLESFEPPKFEELYYETQPDAVSLINFESPVSEESVKKVTTTVAAAKVPGSHDWYTQQNLIVALCGSLHESEADINLTATNNDTPGPMADIDETYLSLEPVAYQENTPWTSSSEDTEDSSQKVIKKHSRSSRRQNSEQLVRRDDDEELRPLIDATHSACSLTASSIGQVACAASPKKCQSSTNDDETSTIALEIAKAIDDSLPETNSQSDSSDPGNVLPSSDDLEFDIPTTPPLNGDSSGSCSTSAKKPSKQGGGAADVAAMSYAGVAGGVSSSSQQTTTNSKKKSKRKKR